MFFKVNATEGSKLVFIVLHDFNDYLQKKMSKGTHGLKKWVQFIFLYSQKFNFWFNYLSLWCSQ